MVRSGSVRDIFVCPRPPSVQLSIFIYQKIYLSLHQVMFVSCKIIVWSEAQYVLYNNGLCELWMSVWYVVHGSWFSFTQFRKPHKLLVFCRSILNKLSQYIMLTSEKSKQAPIIYVRLPHWTDYLWIYVKYIQLYIDERWYSWCPAFF